MIKSFYKKNIKSFTYIEKYNINTIIGFAKCFRG
jgi:hypothetical protein